MFHLTSREKKKEYSIFVFSKFMKNIEIKMKSVWFFIICNYGILFLFSFYNSLLKVNLNDILIQHLSENVIF